jgi:hypothetical protein
MMEGPLSSYSCLLIHIVWKVDSEARIEPPSQTEYFLSGGARIFIELVEGAISWIYFHILWPMPSNRVDPPDKRMF